MAPGRPYWKGYLKLSLVSCPIALYTVTTSATERVSFRADQPEDWEPSSPAARGRCDSRARGFPGQGTRL